MRPRLLSTPIILFAALPVGCQMAPPMPEDLGGLPIPKESFVGQVVAVHDDGTITVLADQTERTVALYGLRTPEPDHALGREAKQYISKLVGGRRVVVQVVSADRDPRDVAVVQLADGAVLNDALVEAGLAWHDIQSAPADKHLARLEAKARAAKRGLWSEPDLVPPWERPAPRQVESRPGKP
jgi:endonuclease YncB( thermonuclease family)